MKIMRRHVGFIYTLSLLASSLFAPVFTSQAHADSNTCAIVTTANASLEAAKIQFRESCPGLQRKDCDPVSENRWMCSTDAVDASTPVQAVLPHSQPVSEPEPDVVPTEEAPAPVQVSDSDSQMCEATGASLGAAINAYALSCPDIPRNDCDPVDDGQWTCSSGVIGESSPGVVIGSPTTVPQEPEVPTTPPSVPVPSEPAPEAEEPTAPTVPEPEEPSTPTEPAPPVNNPGGDVIEHTYSKNDGPFKNPLKGWNSGWDGGNDHPESSVGFQYIAWKKFEPSDGSFDRNAVENIIDNEGSKNRHLILRLYCDWHGNDAESDCPSWMYTDAGVARLQGDNGRYITDFNDARYIAQARDAIQALADEYDNDPRIYAVQMGVIGYWGEWHTWGSSFNGNSYDLTDQTKSAILNAYTGSFRNAKIMARYPWREPTQSAGGIGFHNDYFVANNSHSEEFDTSVSTGSQWMQHPIGGEVPPRSSGEAGNERNSLFNSSTGDDVIETGHYSTMKAGAYRVTQGQQGYEGYMRLHKKMGYNYQIDLARFPQSANTSEQLSVELIGTNIGVAPMYFDWDVQFALLDGSDRPVTIQESGDQLTSILPGAMFNFTSNLALSSVNQGSYRLAVRIVQPGADKPKLEAWKLDARNTYILFSNDLPVINGVWSNNTLVGGWSVLGDVTVQ